MTAFAQGTTVSVAKTRGEIEDILTRYGADQFGTGYDGNRAMIMFAIEGRRVKFVLRIPAKDAPIFKKHPKFSWKTRTDAQALALWEAEHRRLWRALLLVIKAKLEACKSGIVTFEQEFMAQLVMPDGRTVGEAISPQLAQMHETGKNIPLLSGAFD